MVKTLLHFEVNNWLLNRSTIILLVLWAAIILFALSTGSTLVQSRQQLMDSVKSEQTKRLASHLLLMDSFATAKKIAPVYWEDSRNAFGIGSTYGKRTLFKPRNALAPIAIGQSNLHHSDHELTTQPEFWFSALRKSEKLDNPTNLIYGTFDLAFVLVWLLPLVIVIFNYNVISKEREQGTLKLLLSQGVSIKKLLLTRVGFRFISIFLFTNIVIWLGLLWDETIPPISDFIIFSGLVALYTIFWHSLALLVNLSKHSSNYNIGLLFTVWIALVIVLPALLNIVVTTFQPIPGKLLLLDEVRERFTENDQKNSDILDQFYTDHPDFVIKDSAKLMPLFMYKYVIKEMNTSEELQPVMEDYKQKLEAQQKMISILASTIPSMAFQEALEELSGHSLSQHLSFSRFADSASRAWRNYFHPLSLANRYLTLEEFSKLPDPSFVQLFNVTKQLMLAGSLFFWSWILLTAGFFRTRKYVLE